MVSLGASASRSGTRRAQSLLLTFLRVSSLSAFSDDEDDDESLPVETATSVCPSGPKL